VTIFTREIATRENDRQRELRETRTRQIVASGKTEIPRGALEFGSRWIEDTRTGESFRLYPNADPAYAGHCPAFYFDAAGDAVLLERADPASRDELAERRAAREARRAARELEANERRDRFRADR
jgi:hypothetical protein